MPTRDEIQQEIMKMKEAGQDNIRHRYLKELHEYTKRDTLIYFSSYNTIRSFQIPPQALAITQEDIQGFMAGLHGLKGENLDLILHSPGGSLEAADQIVQYLRSKYKHIRAIVPQNAMSAAAMISCACDEIILGKHSAMGPIDPQVNGIPAHTILQDYELAKREVLANPLLANLWAPRLCSIPFGFLNLCEQNIRLSKEKVEQWLGMYMFKGADGQKAKAISDWLGDFNEHRTHGRPIGFDLAESKGLIVKRLEDDQQLQELVMSVYHATMVTFQTTMCLKIIENHNGKGHYFVVALALQQVGIPAPQLGQALPQGPTPLAPMTPTLTQPQAGQGNTDTPAMNMRLIG
jgi:hypothetical protein